MNADQWDRLSTWHAAWLAAAPNERDRLREELQATDPDLLALAEPLVSEEKALGSFLETPAMMLTAARLARDARLEAGTAVGPYRINGLIGSGGMGVVYRATDPRLGRDVAVKMLVPVGAPDAAHLDRFAQEARLTAAIDHPNVVKVFDVGLHRNQPYMVIELLEGEPLRARLERGRLAIAEVQRVILDVARGLAAAHAAGLAHRDLKPENLFLTRSGQTKILDFGIAKLTPDVARQRADASTLTGILLGTAGYLAPEQIRGDGIVDARADLFALGSLMFEMLAGHRSFAGENTVDTLHAILHDPAPDLTAVRPDVPPALARIAAHLLEKEPDNRFQSATDLVWALEQIDAAPPVPTARALSTPGSSRARVPAAWVAAPLVAIALLAGWWLGRQPQADGSSRALGRFSWSLPAGTSLTSPPVVSPDGRSIAWTASDERGTSKLFVRELASDQARAIAGTDGARTPFWSPDSESVGFFARGQLMKVAVDAGTPVTLANAPDARGGTWNAAGVIVFQPLYRDSPLMRVADTGGEVRPVTRVHEAEGDSAHLWPAFLPDGRHFLYKVASLSVERRGIYLGDLDASTPATDEMLFAGDSNAVYAPLEGRSSGVLLSVRNGEVEARLFDPGRRRLLSDGHTLSIGAFPLSPHHPAFLSASAEVLTAGTSPLPWGARFASVLRDGTDLQVASAQELGGFLRLSPDGLRLARARVDFSAANPDIWVQDLARGTEVRVTTSRDFDVIPVWSPDGRQIAFRSGKLTAPTLRVVDALGNGVLKTIPCPASPCEPTDWSPDGRFLVASVGGKEVWAVPLAEGTPPARLFEESFPVRDARISSDGRWIAYVSEESGRPQVSIRSLSRPARRVVVSRESGDQPVWRRDGRELFFVNGQGRLHAVSIRATGPGGLDVTSPVPLKVPPFGERHWGTIYDVSVDGRRIYFPYANADPAPTAFSVVTGWKALLQK